MLDRSAITEAEFNDFVNVRSESCTILTKPYQVIQCYSDQSEANRPASDHDPKAEGAGDASQLPGMRDRFIQTTPKWMQCTDRLEYGHSLEPKRNALGCRYLNPNSPGLIRWQIFDLDRSDAAFAFDDANVAVPNVIIENPKNGHAHYGYALENGVAWSDAGRQKPQGFLKAVRRGMTKRLGGDPNFGHYLAKNPLHTDWRTTWLSTKPYTLNDLSIWLEPEDMQRVHKSRASENDFAQEGRNCSLTSDLAKFALRNAWRYRDAGASGEFQKEMRCHAFALNSAFPEPLAANEVLTIIRSVSKWAWSVSTAEKFSEIQKWRAETRKRRNLEIIGALPDAASLSPSALAEILSRSERTAYRYLTEIRERPKSERQAKPWLALGISRRTYYSRKKSGLLPTSSD
jgi:hypothetical protein